MKAKKKLLSIVLAALMLVPCMAALTACEGGSLGHTHTWEEKYSYNSLSHWKKCTQCSETTQKEDHTYDVDTCKVCGYVDTSKSPAKKKEMSKYFVGVKATYEKESFIDSDGQPREFKDLVDRQIDVLAQDILTRLYYVYGDHRTKTGSYVWGYPFPLFDLNGNESDKIYRYNKSSTSTGKPANADSSNMLAKLDEDFYGALYEGTAALTEVKIDDLSDYQKSLLIKDADKNCLIDINAFNLINASKGGAMSIHDNGYGKILQDDTSKQWIISDLSVDDATGVNETAKTALKLAIAQELRSSDSTNYDYLIKKIDKLGYDSTFAEKLVNIINEKVIGNALVDKDNEYYNIIKTQYGGKINADTVKRMNGSADYSETNSPRLYKGYKVIVPQIVKSALENKFLNTQVSLYPAFNKKAVDYTTNAAGFAEARRYETTTLIPRVGTGYTKLAVKIKGMDVGGGAALSFDVEINDSQIYHKRVSLTNEEQVLEIDLSEYGSRTPFEAYQGNKTADVNNNIFVNSVVDDFDEKNFIKFTFDNRNNAKFIVTFDGYYDKKW